MTSKITAIVFGLFLSWSALIYSPVVVAKTIVTFEHGDDSLVGHYLPATSKEKNGAVILFVHGDGALNYEAEGYYPLIWESLRQQGYSIFSWDKPGVGDSTGNWLSQSMSDRQGEVRAAIRFLQRNYGYSGQQIGLLGFSQAGWVIPAVAANNPNVGFVIGIGFAIDWISQGEYHTKTRLRVQQASAAETAQALKNYRQLLTNFAKYSSYADYRQDLKDDDKIHGGLSEDRFSFVHKNYRVNAYKDYQGIEQPLLILLGEDDLNVDVKDTQRQLLEIFAEKRNMTLMILPNATHSLLKSQYFNVQSPGLWFWLKLMWMEEDALSDEFFPVLESWLRQRASK